MIEITAKKLICDYYHAMIRVIKEGAYKLFETTGQVNILALEKNSYAWINAGKIGELLVKSTEKHTIDHTISIGKFRMYEIKDEPQFTDLIHLELHIGNGKWQGYLLPTGLPARGKIRSRIIPTKETVTKVVH